VLVVAGVVVVVVLAAALLPLLAFEELVFVSEPPQAANTNAKEIESNRETKSLLLIGKFSLRIQTGQCRIN
jgi:hypothetical protein